MRDDDGCPKMVFRRNIVPDVFKHLSFAEYSIDNQEISRRIHWFNCNLQISTTEAPRLNIRSGGVVGEKKDISSQPPVPRTMSVPEVAVPQALEAIVDVSSNVMLASGITVDISSTVPLASRIIVGVSSTIPLASGIIASILSILLLEEFLLSSEDIRRSDKRKMVANDEGKTAMLRRGTEDDGGVRNSRKAKRGREDPSWRVEEHILHSQGTA
ncbi:hypothetical protein Fot_07398 [Forsythia ovata]|uniref:Uncharacterized protein n=1 Tax=Forsythia ovata TaxID=205694 RepID=A0ABD1WVU1_9LAMI